RVWRRWAASMWPKRCRIAVNRPEGDPTAPSRSKRLAPPLGGEPSLACPVGRREESRDAFLDPLGHRARIRARRLFRRYPAAPDPAVAPPAQPRARLRFASGAGSLGRLLPRAHVRRRRGGPVGALACAQAAPGGLGPHAAGRAPDRL